MAKVKKSLYMRFIENISFVDGWGDVFNFSSFSIGFSFILFFALLLYFIAPVAVDGSSWVPIVSIGEGYVLVFGIIVLCGELLFFKGLKGERRISWGEALGLKLLAYPYVGAVICVSLMVLLLAGMIGYFVFAVCVLLARVWSIILVSLVVLCVALFVVWGFIWLNKVLHNARVKK